MSLTTLHQAVRGPSRVKAEAQTTQTDRPNESPTARTTRTRDTTPESLTVSMVPCQDVRETERERREEITRAQRTGGRSIALDNAMDDTNMETGDAGGGQTPSEQDHEERRHTLWHHARQGGTHHALCWDVATQLQRIILRLHRGGTMATMRRNESFVRTLGTAPGKYGSTLYTLRARPVVATELFRH
jgi:hypothetical protein